MKSVKFIIAAVLSIMLCAALFGCAAPAGLPEEGECGEDSVWELKDGTLTVSGEGAVDIPITTVGEVNTIVVDEGITSIGDEIFKSFSSATEITLPEGLISIGEEAFGGLTEIKEIRIPDSVKEIAGDAFEGWEETQKIISEWYEGSAEEWEPYFKLWKEYYEGFKDFLADGQLREELGCFINKWGEYISEHFEEFKNAVGELRGEAEADLNEIIEKLTQFPKELIDDLMALIPDFQRAIENAKEQAGEEYREAHDEISNAIRDLIGEFDGAMSEIGDAKEEIASLIGSFAPEFADAIRNALGLDGDASGEVSGDASGEDDGAAEDPSVEGKNDWMIFWGSIDEDILNKILDEVGKR